MRLRLCGKVLASPALVFLRLLALDTKLLGQVNLTPPGSGDFGLLKNGTKLAWPAALQKERFRSDREKVSAGLAQCFRRAISKRKDFGLTARKVVGRTVATELERVVRRLGEGLREEVADLSPSQYIEARRYLNQLADGLKVLNSPAAGKFADGTHAAQSGSVAELVEHLRRHALQFAPAARGEEKAYRDLYEALAAYRAGLAPR